MQVLVLLVLAGAAQSSILPDSRLPTSVVPIHYNLSIVTYLEPEFKFLGNVSITIECKHRTDNITLHAEDLNIDDLHVSVTTLKSHQLKKKKISRGVNRLYTVELERTLEPDQIYVLFIPFSGNLSSEYFGYFKCPSSSPATNETRWIAATHFEPTRARKAFPCFDEPALRATFSISLGHREELKSISNMPISHTAPMTDKEGWVWDHFEESVPMSTYLVAFVIGDLEYVASTPIRNDLEVKIWARHDLIRNTNFSNKITPVLIEWLEEYFGINYPLPKIDMVAIPFLETNAMENWGLIIYRESDLLLDNRFSYRSAEINIAAIVAHELTHMWIGNLVNIEFWNELWLKEGLATFFEKLGAEYINPELDVFMLRNLEDRNMLLLVDSYSASSPVHVDNINFSSDIHTLFAYKKGSLINFMMHNMLGKETFRKGLTRYLEKFRYITGNRYDLWETLTRQAHIDGVLEPSLTMKTIMEPWVTQAGFPLITVKRDYISGKATISQRRYVQAMLRDRTWLECWWVPLSYTFQASSNFSDTQPKEWLNCSSENAQLSMPPADQWVILNTELSGLYRVNYDNENWNLISQTLNSDNYTTIATVNRAQIIDDALDLAFNGDISYEVPVRVMKYLRREKEAAPWIVAFPQLFKLKLILRPSPIFDIFQSFMKNLLEPIYEVIQNPESDFYRKDFTYLRKLVRLWACEMDAGNCKLESVTFFKEWMNGTQPHNPILASFPESVYCSSAEALGEKAWVFLSTIFSNNYPPDILRCTTDQQLLEKHLDLMLDRSSGVPPEVFQIILSNRKGFEVAKNFLYRKFDEIYEYSIPTTVSFIKLVGSYIATNEEKDEYFSFLETKSHLIKEDEIKEAKLQAASNAEWTANRKMQFLGHMTMNM